MNLIILERNEVGADGRASLSDGRAAHLLKVLRVEPGHTVRVGVVDGPRGIATVQAIGGGLVTLRCTLDADIPPRPAVDLLLAVPRPKVMRRLWAQIAALGVGQIILTNAEKVERNYFDTHILAPDTYRPLLIEGLQQARDTRVPVVSIHRQFRILIEDALDGLSAGGLRVVADPGSTRSLRDITRPGAAERMMLAIGPEGGWNAFELELLAAHGFQSVGMGPRTLRTDTACVALLALAHSAMGNSDFSGQISD
ncbi:MAG: putative methyltransferase [Acidobacteria bacterium]|nr:putative methyltransferase [Acidobacteriota bacterium]